MNAAQSHASLLLLAVMGVPWLIDRAFTWLEDSAAHGRRLERRVVEASVAAYRAKYPLAAMHGPGWAGIVCEGNTWSPSSNASPSL